METGVEGQGSFTVNKTSGVEERGSLETDIPFEVEENRTKQLDFPTIMDEFSLDCPDAAGYSSLALAYIGDCVYDLVIRTLVVGQNHTSVNDLHHRTIHYVKAESQANAADALAEYLTPEEADIYRRARNAKSNTKAKNASIVAYRKATGLEAVIGYLYIQNKTDRILELMSLALGAAAR
ncbi:MAG: ribonuclease III [Lachnospiraceae bacterium]|nr:ribonuclease III [Lachnospiraceae bacterium]